jgi:hypothetical protein
MVGCDKIPAWISHNRNIEIFESVDDIFAEAVLIGERITGVVNAAVNASSHMPVIWVSEHGCEIGVPTRLLGETSIYVVVYLCNFVRRMNGDGRSFILLDAGECRHGADLDNFLPRIIFMKEEEPLIRPKCSTLNLQDAY